MVLQNGGATDHASYKGVPSLSHSEFTAPTTANSRPGATANSSRPSISNMRTMPAPLPVRSASNPRPIDLYMSTGMHHYGRSTPGHHKSCWIPLSPLKVTRHGSTKANLLRPNNTAPPVTVLSNILLSPGHLLKQPIFVTDAKDIQQECVDLWTSRWNTAQQLTPSKLDRIYNFAQAHALSDHQQPQLPCIPVNINRWNCVLAKYAITCAMPDNYDCSLS